MTILGVPTQALFGQLLIGLINGAFYAMLSLGLSVIFGLLNIINFTHGAQYMMGAFVAYFLLQWAGLGYWWALLIAPVVVGIIGIALERTTLKRLYHLDHLYGLLLTFGFALIIQGLFRHEYGSSGLPYSMPRELAGGQNLGFMFLPNYRAWVIVFSLAVCLTTWYVIERTRLGSYLRAATENPALVQAFGINVPRMITLTYGFGVGLAALAGVLAAPIYQVNPLMGADLIIVVFAVVVIGVGILAGCQPTSPEGLPNETLVEDDFSNPSSGWQTFNEQAVSMGYMNGTYRMLLNEPIDDWESFRRVNKSYSGVSVEVDVTISGPPGAVGVECVVGQAPASYARSYGFLIAPEAGTYAIGKSAGTDGGRTLTKGENAAAVHAGTNHIKGECMGGVGGEPTILTMWVNGQQVGQFKDGQGFQSFAGMGLLVVSGEKGGTEAVYDNALMSRI